MEDAGEGRQIIDDVEDEGRGEDVAHQNGKDERKAVEPLVTPQLTELVGVVFTHDDGTQQGTDECQRE